MPRVGVWCDDIYPNGMQWPKSLASAHHEWATFCDNYRVCVRCGEEQRKPRWFWRRVK